MSDVTRDINTLNGLIQKLQVAYDQYFAGSLKREPLDMVREAEGIIGTYSGGRVENPVQRYRFNGLVARYSSFKKVWERKRRGMEGGAPEWRSYSLKTAPSTKDSFSYLIPEGPLRERQVLEIFDHYKSLRRRCSESVETIRFENFKVILYENVARIRQRAETESVLVKLDIYQHRARISARPFQR